MYGTVSYSLFIMGKTENPTDTFLWNVDLSCSGKRYNHVYTSTILWKVYNKLTKVLSASRSGELSKVQTHALSRLHWSSARVASVAYASPLWQFGTDR